MPPGAGQNALPTARDEGFADAVRKLVESRARGDRSAPLVVATLSPNRLQQLRLPGGEPRAVRLSRQTAEDHERFLDFTGEDWRRIEKLLTEGPNWLIEGPNWVEGEPGWRRVLWTEGEKPWKVVIKQAQEGERQLFLVTAHREKLRKVKKLREAQERQKA